MSRKISKFDYYILTVIISFLWRLLPIRLENINLNEVFSQFNLLYIAIGVGICSKVLIKKVWLNLLISIPSFIASGLIFLGLILELLFFIGGGKSLRNYKPIECISLENSRVVQYVIGGGATVDNSVIIDQEMRLLPGLIMHKQLYYEYKEIYVEMKLDKNKVLHIKGNSGVKLIQLSPFVYF